MEEIELPLWNRFHLPCPGTSAHKLDLSSSPHLRGVLQRFVTCLQDQIKHLEESVNLVQIEAALLKRFLYKLTSVFCHDKGYKMMKQIQKSINKFLTVDIAASLRAIHEQHSLISSAERFVFVPPKPKLEFVLVRLQGTARLLAQVLCYCQRFASFTIQKIHFGHFMNISVICMSFAARLWAMSLHVMHLLTSLYGDVRQIYHSKGYPESSVHFLPECQVLPGSLLEWLRADSSLKAVHSLLKRTERRDVKEVPAAKDEEIWDSVPTEDDEERKHLLQLKQLVMGNKEISSKPNEVEPLPAKEQPSLKFEADLGEIVLRETTTLGNSKKKKKKNRGKKRKMNGIQS